MCAHIFPVQIYTSIFWICLDVQVVSGIFWDTSKWVLKNSEKYLGRLGVFGMLLWLSHPPILIFLCFCISVVLSGVHLSVPGWFGLGSVL